MPRLRKVDRTRYRWTLDTLCAVLEVQMWERFWGGEAEGRAAWEAMRDTCPHGGSVVGDWYDHGKLPSEKPDPRLEDDDDEDANEEDELT